MSENYCLCQFKNYLLWQMHAGSAGWNFTDRAHKINIFGNTIDERMEITTIIQTNRY